MLIWMLMLNPLQSPYHSTKAPTLLLKFIHSKVCFFVAVALALVSFGLLKIIRVYVDGRKSNLGGKARELVVDGRFVLRSCCYTRWSGER